MKSWFADNKIRLLWLTLIVLFFAGAYAIDHNWREQCRAHGGHPYHDKHSGDACVDNEWRFVRW